MERGLALLSPGSSAERAMQKRLYTGTVEGKVNAADSLSLLFFSISLFFFLSETHSFSLLTLVVSFCLLFT